MCVAESGSTIYHSYCKQHLWPWGGYWVWACGGAGRERQQTGDTSCNKHAGVTLLQKLPCVCIVVGCRGAVCNLQQHLWSGLHCSTTAADGIFPCNSHLFVAAAAASCLVASAAVFAAWPEAPVPAAFAAGLLLPLQHRHQQQLGRCCCSTASCCCSPAATAAGLSCCCCTFA